MTICSFYKTTSHVSHAIAMDSSTTLLVLFSFFLLSLSASLTQAQTPDFLFHFCVDDNGNYTANSTFQTNLDRVFSDISSLSSNTQYNGGFYNFSAGNSPDRVNSVALCRGDVTPDACRSCLNNSTTELLERCPNQKQATGWYDNCMFRYSNASIPGPQDGKQVFYMWNPANVSSSYVDEFNDALSGLLNKLVAAASSGGPVIKFATGNASATPFQTIYALVQCTPDLSQRDCNNCLIGAISALPNCCSNKIGGRYVSPTCNLRYETSLFYEITQYEVGLSSSPQTPSPPPLESPPPSNSTGAQEEGDKKSQSVVVIVVPVVVSVVLILCLGICLFLRFRKPRKNIEIYEDADEITSVDSLQYDLGTIRAATNNFSDANKLGQGGFGAVYQGKLSDGQEIAVKRLSQNSGQGDSEFKNEVVLVAKLQHRNLARLLGFSLESDERLLIYEFMPNKSLDHFLFDPMKREQLDWESRYRIIGGTARGLLYLHEDSRLRIIHRDLKASNILLDADMNPKISDFGMARLFVRDETQGNTSRIVGTYGYMAPEYAMHGHFSVKTDVFSFGVLVLETVSGQKNNSFRGGENMEDLLSYAWRNWREGTAINLVDPTMRSASRSEVMRCVHIALLCVQHNVADRPTMNSIVLMLNSYSLSLPVPSQPAFFADSRVGLSDISSSQGNYSASSDHSYKSKTKPASEFSSNDDSITDLYPR